MGKMLDAALHIMVDAHAGRYDRIGEPEVLHPIAVMMSVEPGDNDEETEIRRTVAALHDVEEIGNVDNLWIGTRLWEEIGRPDIDTSEDRMLNRVMVALQDLTRQPGRTYDDYIICICKSNEPVSRAVKIADIHHNISRPDIPGKKDSLRPRYQKALGVLMHADLYGAP